MLKELPATIKECLEQISSNGEGLIFLVRNSILQGSLSDGDIRRALLEGAELNDSVEDFINKNVHSLTEFKRNTTRFLEHLKQTKDPLVLTVDGKAALVVQDAESYQTLLEAAELVETLKGVKRGLEEMKQGKGKKAEEFFSELFDKLDSSP